jgi:hypothetical protein
MYALSVALQSDEGIPALRVLRWMRCATPRPGKAMSLLSTLALRDRTARLSRVGFSELVHLFVARNTTDAPLSLLFRPAEMSSRRTPLLHRERSFSSSQTGT